MHFFLHDTLRGEGTLKRLFLVRWFRLLKQVLSRDFCVSEFYLLLPLPLNKVILLWNLHFATIYVIFYLSCKFEIPVRRNPSRRIAIIISPPGQLCGIFCFNLSRRSHHTIMSGIIPRLVIVVHSKGSWIDPRMETVSNVSLFRF